MKVKEINGVSYVSLQELENKCENYLFGLMTSRLTSEYRVDRDFIFKDGLLEDVYKNSNIYLSSSGIEKMIKDLGNEKTRTAKTLESALESMETLTLAEHNKVVNELKEEIRKLKGLDSNDNENIVYSWTLSSIAEKLGIYSSNGIPHSMFISRVFKDLLIETNPDLASETKYTKVFQKFNSVGLPYHKVYFSAEAYELVKEKVEKVLDSQIKNLIPGIEYKIIFGWSTYNIVWKGGVEHCLSQQTQLI